MPFDGTTKSKAKVEVTAQPSLALLRNVLRDGKGHPLWPSQFKFNYNNYTTCAVGLARELWPLARELWPGAMIGYDSYYYMAHAMAQAFGMPLPAAFHIFSGLPMKSGRKKVAKAIDKYLHG